MALQAAKTTVNTGFVIMCASPICIVACAYYWGGIPGNPEKWYALGMRGKKFHLQMVCARYARGLRKACSHLPGNIACGFWGLPSGPLCGDPAGASRNPQGTLQDPFREPPRGPYSPPSPPPSPPPGWVWYAHGMRMVCARYARMVIVAWSLQWDPEGGSEWGPVCAPK